MFLNKNMIESKLVELLKENKYHISFAESMTGGMLASTIINVSGASDVIEKSFITYSNKAKHDLLNVNYETIDKFDVVSVEVVKEMLAGLKLICDSEVLCSVSGYASGYLENKGKVCYAININDNVYTNEIIIDGDRNGVRMSATEKILNDIYMKLKEGQ